MLLMRGNSSKYAYPAYWNFCVNKHFGTLFRTTGPIHLLVDLAPRRYHQPSCQIFLTLNCHLDIHKISSIKIWKTFKTPRLVSMYCTGSSPRFWIWLTFSNEKCLKRPGLRLHIFGWPISNVFGDWTSLISYIFGICLPCIVLVWMLLMRGNSSKYAYPAYWNFCVNKHFGTLFRTTGPIHLLVDYSAPKVSPAQLSDFSDIELPFRYS